MANTNGHAHAELRNPGTFEAPSALKTLLFAFTAIGILAFAGGLPFAERLARSGKQVFLDVKLLDIGNTVAGAVKSIAAMGMTFVTVHAYPQAMRAAGLLN